MCQSWTQIYMVITGIAVKLESRSALSPLASCWLYLFRGHDSHYFDKTNQVTINYVHNEDIKIQL